MSTIRTIAVTALSISITETDGGVFAVAHRDVQLPENCTVEDAITALKAVEARFMPMSGADDSLPEGLCGAIHENPTADESAWGRCVFTKDHEGNHSWQK